MRLTNSIRNNIVDSIMNDVPTEDFQTQFEKLVHKESYKQLPEQIKKIYDNPELRKYLGGSTVRCFNSGLGSILTLNSEFDESKIRISMDAIAQRNNIQKEDRRRIKNQILIALDSVSTIKAARDLMPEFDKYFPKPNQVMKYPIANNIVSDLKSMGWTDRKTAKKES